jgi:hypothetical protein
VAATKTLVLVVVPSSSSIRLHIEDEDDDEDEIFASCAHSDGKQRREIVVHGVFLCALRVSAGLIAVAPDG